MRTIAAALTLLLLTGTVAYAQQMPTLNLLDNDKPRDPAQEEKQREIDKAYREKLRSAPAQQAPAANDPWGNVRNSAPAQGKTQGAKKQ